MKNKTLWLTWLYLFVFCCIIGFIPEPDGLIKALMVLVGIGFFVPGFFLLRKQRNCRPIFLISIASLLLTTVTIILNFASIFMKPIWGTVLYILMGTVSTPMLCGQIWIISICGWAILLAISGFLMKKRP